MSKTQLDVGEALDRFFSVVRQEASDNPKFAARLLEALGVQVMFRGDATAPAIDPVQVAMQGQEEFRKTFLTFSAKDLKGMVKEFNLGTADDLKGKGRPAQIVDVMWAGAQAKMRDRGIK